MKKFTVDRIEEGKAVLECENGEMVSLDRKFRRLLSELVPSEDAALQEKYIHELQELRDIMNRIWLLLMANYDVKKAGKKGVSSDGND